MGPVFDIAIIGGGINGAGIARDAAGRGHSVFLCEMGDLASGTSSWSTKLIHGGLRYLEYREFCLVREALTEREVLLAIAPHIIAPLRLVLPHHDGLRPKWLLRLGMFLYDHLGARQRLPGTATIDLARDPLGAPLVAGRFKTGFEFSDCFADDARLVVLNAHDAAGRGAEIATRTKAVGARRVDGVWQLDVSDAATGARRTIAARTLVNAAGPWVDRVLQAELGVSTKSHVRLVQGSHIVVRRLYAHDRAYMFQNGDGRIVFVIPYEGDFTLIGTTEREFSGDPATATASEADIDYLCAACAAYLSTPVTRADVVWAFSGVRPLYDDGARDAKAATREYVFELDVPGDGAPLLSIFGGKITTYRRLAEAALDRLGPFLRNVEGGLSKGWTGRTPLPGGDVAVDGLPALAADLLARFPFLAPPHAKRLARSYGTRANAILASANSMTGLGEHFGATLTGAEVRYLMDHEWARTAEDVVWRRSKLGLRLSESEIARLGAWMAAHEKSGTAHEPV